eukprot:12775859-Alexandrium_andersonii.AAC.1
MALSGSAAHATAKARAKAWAEGQGRGEVQGKGQGKGWCKGHGSYDTERATAAIGPRSRNSDFQ